MRPVNEQLEILRRGAAEIISEAELAAKLKEDRPLRVKFGADPTAPDIHLGHTVVMRKLRQFQDLGHHVVFLIGDFTAMIGDPSGRSATRKPLSRAEVESNAKTYLEQAFKVLDRSKTEVVYNSAWCRPMALEDVIGLMSKYTLARILERDDFEKRYKGGQPIHMHETLYPLLQGHDSVVLKADVEMCGTDQKFNCLVGRALQEEAGQPRQAILSMPLMEGLDGVKKMSKSYGNYVGVLDSPKEMYGKLMSIPDALIHKYLTLLTDTPLAEIAAMQKRLAEGENPRDQKAALARTIVALYHDDVAARGAEAEFRSVFSGHGLPAEIPELRVAEAEVWIAELLVRAGHSKSNGEARRLVAGGGVSLLDGSGGGEQKIGDEKAKVAVVDGAILKAGKRGFYRLRRG